MNQDDFRRLLDSGGGGSRKHGSGRSAQGNITSLDADGVRKLQAKKSSKKKGNKPHKDGGGGGDDDDDRARHAPSAYRDRAAERRQGGTADMIDADEFKHLDADQSKFLGGDMAHTHLVKGLDFSLLAQLKRERQKLEQATAAERKKHSNGDAASGSKASNAASEDAEPTFQTRLGRMIYLHVCKNRPLSKDAKTTKSELFLPGRMYYTFNLLSTDFESIPTAVQRSKEDCPELDDVVTGLVDDMIISDVKRVLEEKHTAKKMRRKREESKRDEAEEKKDPGTEDGVEFAVESGAEESKAPSDDDDDFDIFPDAGEYVPAYLRGEEKLIGDADKTSSQGYFSNLSASLTEAEREAERKEREAEDAWKATLKKAAAAQSQAEKEEAMRAREAKLAAAQDSYGEYQLGNDEDSEEDEEETARKRKAAADAKKDGAVDGEEMARRKKQKQGNKLENDLKKINKLMETKK